MSVEEIVPRFPPLKPADVHDTIAYAYDHIVAIEAELAPDIKAELDATCDRPNRSRCKAKSESGNSITSGTRAGLHQLTAIHAVLVNFG